jgi:opacity protein-like surface antigen
MGSLKTLALAGVLAVSASALANAADLAYPPPPPPEPLGLKGTSGGWYLRGDIGVSATTYRDIEVLSNGAPVLATPQVSSFSVTKSDATFGAFAGIGIGYQFNSYLRFDVTGEYRGSSITGRDHVAYDFGVPTQQTNSYRGDISSFVGLANGYIDLGTWNCLTPYLGLGIGVARHTINGFSDNGIIRQPATNANDTGTSFGFADSASKTTLAWALMAGVAYDVSSNLKLELGYRYLNMGDAPAMGLRGGNGGLLANPSSSVRFKELDSHDIRIGMRWNFSDSDCCGPKERPVAYAPPVVRKY